jgi:hypothetical protein
MVSTLLPHLDQVPDVRSAKNTSSTKPGADTRVNRNKNRPGKNKIERSYIPQKQKRRNYRR